jgi:hypothetical protein
VEQSLSSCLLFPSGYKAGLDDALARPDVLVFPPVAVDHLDLRLPFRGVADSHPDAVSLLDVDRDAVRRVCLDTVDAIPEDRRGLPVQKDEAAGKLAVREPRLADAVPARREIAWAAFPEIPASVGLVERWAQLRAAAELYTPDEALSAA